MKQFMKCVTKKLKVETPSYRNLNQIIAQVISSITTSLRFKGTLNVDLNEFQTNLVPFPRIHFMLSSLAPVVSVKDIHHETLSTQELTKSAFDQSNLMAKCNPTLGKYIACCLMYRGDVQNKEVSDAQKLMKSKKVLFNLLTGLQQDLNVG